MVGYRRGKTIIFGLLCFAVFSFLLWWGWGR